MILTCSSCATRYLVDPTSVGPEGRDVRCARCGNIWFQQPSKDLPHSVNVFDADLNVSDPMAYRPAPNLPALRRPGPPVGLIAGWVALIALIAAIAVGAYALRDRVVTLWPASSRLYAALDVPVPGLALRDVAFQRQHDGNVALLVVTGSIVNASDQPSAAPMVRIALRDGVQREIGREDIPIDARRLEPHAQTRFTARLINPPPEARNLEITLVGP